MSGSNVIPMFPPEPPFKDRLAARRAYRERMKVVAHEYVGKAFSASCKGMSADIDDAVPMFVAAIRRELRKIYPC